MLLRADLLRGHATRLLVFATHEVWFYPQRPAQIDEGEGPAVVIAKQPSFRFFG